MLARVRNIFITGLAVLVPVILTFWILRVIFQFADNILGRYLSNWLGVPPPPGLGILLTLTIVFLTGLVASNIIGRRLILLGERLLERTPVVRHVYSTLKQVTEAFMGNRAGSFKRVVLVQYPREGLWAVGLVTGRSKGYGPERGEGDMVHVFIPTTPNPTSGYLILVPEEDLVTLNLTIEEGMRLIISGGVVSPQVACSPGLSRKGE